jgi:trimeric autotransporter adhesin
MKGICVVMLTLFSFGCGYGTQKTTPASPGIMPAISQLAPNSATSGGAGFVLTVNGSNFASNSVINWNATAQPTTFVTASQITASIPAAAVATPGAVTVTVTNPGTMGGIYGGGTQSESSAGTTFTIN